MGCCSGCEGRRLTPITASASDWVILEAGASTGVAPYIYSASAVSRYRTEEYGKVARVQLVIEDPSPNALTVPTSVAQMPGAISTGYAWPGGGIAVAPSSTPNLMFPVSVNAGLITVICAATILEMSDNGTIDIDITYPLD